MTKETKNRLNLPYAILFILFLSACAPECPKIETVENTGRNIHISMNACGSTASVFELDATLNLTERSSDGLNSTQKIQLGPNGIHFKKYKDFEYDIIFRNHGDLSFSLMIRLQEGYRVNLEEIDGNASKPQDVDSISFGPNWTASFRFDGTIVALEDGSSRIRLVPSELNTGALDIFTKNAAGFNETFSFDLSISE